MRGFIRAERAAAVALVVALCAVGVVAVAPAAVDPAEAATARYLASVRNQPSALLLFLREMPKGGDLHNHLSGAIYAESYLRWSADDGLCLATETMSLVPPPCSAPNGRPPATAALQDASLYSQAIDAMSMRNWDRALNGHDHFFATFGKFGPSSGKIGDMLAEVTTRAAAEHVSYLELMLTPDGGAASALGRTTGWDADLARLRDRLLAAGLRDVVVTQSRQRLDAADARRRDLQHCDTPQADAGCAVTVRYIAQVSRASSREQVFAQMLGWYELAGLESRVVSLNLVQPEDDPTAIRDFPLQMSMLAFLHGLYPAVRVTLHAGELTDGLVPPESLRFHVRESVRTGHASRIGHGVDVVHEDDAVALLKEMAAKRILVEIALTSNDVILGVSGKRHPLQTYLKYGVPVALVTDDAGVARSSLTLEFLKAVEEQGIDYLTLKKMVRNSIALSFADAATKTRLRSDLEAAFRSFEHRTRS